MEIVATKNSNELIGVDNFKLSQGVNYVDGPKIEASIEDIERTQKQAWSKRVSTEKLTSRRKGEKPSEHNGITHMLGKNVESVEEIWETINKYNPNTIDDCLKKIIYNT